MVGQRVGVVMGGSSGERDVSLRTGDAIARALEDRGHEVSRIELGAADDWSSRLRAAKIDVAFLALHGRLGEDGCVQGMCEVLGIPYTGSSVLASALAMDKVKAKELFRLHNIPTPSAYTFTVDDDLADIEEIHGSFGFPAIVKPRGEGSSLGVAKVNGYGELVEAVRKALQLDDVVLVERYVAAREVQVGVLDGRVLGAIEVAPKKGIYDYEAKYTPGMTEYFMPARLPPTRYLGVLNLAERAVRALGCSGACRVDLLVTEDANEYVLEVNTLPGMTPTSLLPKIAHAAGYDFTSLCESILSSARLHACTRKRPAREKQHSEVEQLSPAVPFAQAV
ncbi:MAG TPA: D-alanine--D-alanine ligase [Polyangiaceae bacterium]|nr:D-alanine--D-alanine ligase [Polyangiaceae bacterium]